METLLIATDAFVLFRQKIARTSIVKLVVLLYQRLIVQFIVQNADIVFEKLRLVVPRKLVGVVVCLIRIIVLDMENQRVVLVGMLLRGVVRLIGVGGVVLIFLVLLIENVGIDFSRRERERRKKGSEEKERRGGKKHVYERNFWEESIVILSYCFFLKDKTHGFKIIFLKK